MFTTNGRGKILPRALVGAAVSGALLLGIGGGAGASEANGAPAAGRGQLTATCSTTTSSMSRAEVARARLEARIVALKDRESVANAKDRAHIARFLAVEEKAEASLVELVTHSGTACLVE